MKLYVNTKKLLADLQTPVGIYLKIRDLYANSVLLESSDYHANSNSFSFVAFTEMASISVNKFIVTEKYPDGSTLRNEVINADTIPERFDFFTSSFEVIENDEKPIVNGLFGYTSYEAVQYFKEIKLSARETETGSMPGLHYLFFKYVIAINHYNNELTIIENLLENETSNISKIEKILLNNNIALYDFKAEGESSSNMSDDEFAEIITKGKAECKNGKLSQIVLSRRFQQKFSGDDFTLYRHLRSINPSPYLFYFNFGDFRIFGSSPEAHLVADAKSGRASIKPIAGTFRRTGDDEKDLALAEKLKNDPKEKHEHLLLVELAIRDLQESCTDIRIDTLSEVQYYSHVIHLVSLISGKLKPGAKIIKLFADTFPAGTLSGIPRLETMAAIDQLEPHDRGPYGGCIGYIGLDGSFNQAITIRSFVSKCNTLYYQAGAGVVAMSDAESEVNEANNKLAALQKAITKADSSVSAQ